MTSIPGPWADLLDKAGITSIRQLAKAAGLNHTVVNPVIMKGTATSPDNMVKIAAVLSVPVEELYFIRSGFRNRPLSVPNGTEKLSERQKDAVAELIRSMIEEKENGAQIVDKKSIDPAEPVQEKSGSVTPIGGRSRLTPMQRKFEDSGRKVARINREIAQDSPSIGNDLPPLGE